MTKKTKVSQMIEQVFELNNKIKESVQMIINESKLMLKTNSITFLSDIERDGGKFSEVVFLAEIDGVFFDEDDVKSLNVKDIEKEMEKLTKNPGSKEKNFDDCDRESEKVAIYCLKKNIKPHVFLETFNDLISITDLPLPENCVKNV